MLIKKLFSDASQAKLAATYRDLRIKIHTKIADIHFNKECIRNNVTPQYAKIKLKRNSIAAQKTKEEAEKLFIENMIKQLYREKEVLNMESYNVHLLFNKRYGHVAFRFLHGIVTEEIEEIMDRKYARINNKLDLLLGKYQPSIEETEQVDTLHQFQSRVINLTGMKLEENETKILNYGLKHNFANSLKKESELLATDIEANIRQLKDKDNSAVRQDINTNIHNNRKLIDRNQEELKTCIELSKRLEENNSIAVKADKSNAIVLLTKEDYIKKTEDFIKENNFKELARDPTEKYQKELTDAIKKCPKVITEENRAKMNIANSKAPVMRGIPKIHKTNVPIRPLVNFKCAPTYNISKVLARNLNNDLELEYKYNVKNSFDFVEKVKHSDLKLNSRLVSFDVSNLYTNVPVNETIDLIKHRLIHNGLDKIYVNQTVKLLKIVLKQNYFRFNNRFYTQAEGLAMGNPLSAILSEVFLQYNEEIILEKLKKHHEILFYVRYVDDILIMFNETKEEEKEEMMTIFNSHHPNLLFTNEFEENGKINFLDLTLIRRSNILEFDIYRKPTQTDTTISNESVHPISHKIAAFRSMLYRAYRIPLSEFNRNKEIKTIKKIALSNGYQAKTIDEIGAKIKRKLRSQERIRNTTTLTGKTEEKIQYVTFNYTGIRTQKIANRFKKYGVSVAFKTQNTIGKILQPKIEERDKFNTPGIYKIRCNDCDNFYIGQTINFNKRYKNHISAWKNEKPDRSNVAKHLLENCHTLGSIEENLDIIKSCNKGNIMNAWEELFIYKEKCKDREKLMNEQVNFESGYTYRNIFQPIGRRITSQ